MIEVWDWVITLGVLSTLGLAIWAKVSNQTVIELLRDIRDYISEIKDERGEELLYYD